MKLLDRGVERIKSSKCVKDLEKWLVFVQFSISTSYYYLLVSILGSEDASKRNNTAFEKLAEL